MSQTQPGQGPQSNVVKRDEMMQVIQQTPSQNIAELDFVRERFVTNYNVCNKEKVGELMYYRQVVHFKQMIAADDKLKNSDPFSLYACFITAAVKGYSLDPEDKEVYLLAVNGVAKLWRQAGAHVRRLIQTNQIQFADQAKIVYRGDEFEVENGRVVKHKEKFQSEDMIGGYIRMVLDDKGNDRFFIYRKSDWEAWRKKSKQANGENWNFDQKGNPNPGFIRTKIVKHACQEKCWAVGTTPANVQEVQGYEIEDEDEIIPGSKPTAIEKTLPLSTSPTGNPPSNSAGVDDFAQGAGQQPTLNVTTDNQGNAYDF